MKIGYLIPEWPGQSHVWAWREISHLRELGLEVTIFSTRRPKGLSHGKHAFANAAESQAFYLWPMRSHQILFGLLWALCCHPIRFLSCLWLGCRLPVYHQPAWKSVLPLILPACRLALEVKRRKIEHIHTPIPANSAILCMMVKRLVKVPFSLAIVADFAHWGGAMQEKLIEAEFVALVGQWMIKQMQQDFSCIPAIHYDLVRHGVDTEKWVPHTRTTSLGSQPKRILSIGRLIGDKGFDVLLKAVALVRDQGIAFQLEIAGEGPERASLEALIHHLHLNSEVELLGSLSEKDCLAKMQAADLFVLATRSEGLGIVFLEAMSVEVAPIGTSVGGVVEIIQDGVNGLLVPPNQVEKLAAAIVRLLTDDTLRSQLGKAGRQIVLQQFDSRHGAAALHNLLLRNRRSVKTWVAEQSTTPFLD